MRRRFPEVLTLLAAASLPHSRPSPHVLNGQKKEGLNGDSNGPNSTLSDLAVKMSEGGRESAGRGSDAAS